MGKERKTKKNRKNRTKIQKLKKGKKTQLRVKQKDFFLLFFIHKN